MLNIKFTKTALFCLLISLTVKGQRKDQGIRFINEITADSVFFHLENNYHAPITIQTTPNLEMEGKIRVNKATLVSKRDTLFKTIAVPLNLVIDTTAIDYSQFIEFKGNLGDANLTEDTKHLYALPFEKGKAYEIMQANFGRVSHDKKTSFYAIDFTMPEGTPVHAARAGIVIKTQDKYTEHGGEELKYKANTIAIFHEDGTIGHYDHLQPQGVFVKPGDYVKTGQYIGLSGYTGYTTKPHLHFVVQNGKNEAVPIYFKAYKNKVLKQGKHYKNKK